MTKDEAITSAVAAIHQAETYLKSGAAELAYSWSVIADTWANIARAIDDPDDWEVVDTIYTSSDTASD